MHVSDDGCRIELAFQQQIAAIPRQQLLRPPELRSVPLGHPGLQQAATIRHIDLPLQTNDGEISVDQASSLCRPISSRPRSLRGILRPLDITETSAEYVLRFKCSLRRLVEYTNLWPYTRDLYQQPGIANTVRLDEIRHHYFPTHAWINPSGLVAVPPAANLDGARASAKSDALAVSGLAGGADRYDGPGPGE